MAQFSTFRTGTPVLRAALPLILLLPVHAAFGQVDEADRLQRCANNRAALAAIEQEPAADTRLDEGIARDRAALLALRRELVPVATLLGPGIERVREEDLENLEALQREAVDEAMGRARAIGASVELYCLAYDYTCVLALRRTLEKRIDEGAPAVEAAASRRASRDSRAAPYRTNLIALRCDGGASSGPLIGKVTLPPPYLEDLGALGYTRSSYSERSSVWERDDKRAGLKATVQWNYNGVPASVGPGQAVSISVTGGVVSESPKGAGDGLALSGVVKVSGDITWKYSQQADRAHPGGQYEFVVNPNAQSVEIQLDGAPMGPGTIWKYTRDAANAPSGNSGSSSGGNSGSTAGGTAGGAPGSTTSAASRTLRPWEDPSVPHEMGTPKNLRPEEQPAGPRLIGCFKDSPAFDLDGHLERSNSNTPQACASKCATLGFRYAGVQYGESCLCGNSYGRYGAAANCDYRCTGDSTQVCGGNSANSVYETGAGGGGK